jgi:hypothetical protein
MPSTSAAVQTVLNNLHQTLYGNSLSKYYKTDLMSLTGTLDFSSYSSGISMIKDETGNPLFASLININSIDLTGCTSIATSGIMNNQTFPTMPYLTTLSLNGCTSITGVVDFSNCPKLVTLDIRNAAINAKFDNSNHEIATLQLGSPDSVYIKNPKVLVPSGVSIQSKDDITSLDIINVPNCKSFTTFAKIMNIS